MDALEARQWAELNDLREFFDRWCRLHDQCKDMRNRSDLTVVDKHFGATLAQKLFEQASKIKASHYDD